MADTDPRLFPALPNVGGSFSSDDKSWIMKEVEAGTSLPGLYPPNAENKARYEATKKG